MALSPQLTTRVTNILKQPAQEWPVIAAEPADVVGLIQGYAAPLAAIPAVCRWIGLSVIGMSLPFMGTYRVGIVRGLVSAIVSWVFALVGAYIGALIIEKLAPTFKSSGNTAQALKLVVYASTPVWVAGVLNLLPALSPLIIIAALYAVYLFYLGLPTVMKTPSDQVIPYMVVSAIVVIVVSVCLAFVAAALSGVGAYSGL
jgi:Yip1-like protein